MPNGYWDRILHVDLKRSETRVESLGDAFWRRHLGGRALIAHYLLTEVPDGRRPTRSGNVLIFAGGVLTGTPFPGAGRHSVGAKSPLTGPSASPRRAASGAPSCATPAGTRIVVHGTRRKPGLPLDQRTTTSRSATPRTCGARDRRGRRRASRQSMATDSCASRRPASPAKTWVRFALVVNDLNEVAGRTGMGAVMGSKNLKAIAVRGTQQGAGGRPEADPADAPCGSATRWTRTTTTSTTYGTGAAMRRQASRRPPDRAQLPGRPVGPGADRAIDAKTFESAFGEKMDGCYACSVRCKKRVEGRGDERASRNSAAPSTRPSARSAPTCSIDDLPSAACATSA